jgi:hypothetical protein
VRRLQKDGVLKPEYVTLFTELRYLRNRAAHEADFNVISTSVQSFARLAYELAAEAKRGL